MTSSDPELESRGDPPPAGDDAPGAVPARRGLLLVGAVLLAGLLVTCELWTSTEIAYSPRSDIIAEHLTVKTAIRRAVLEEGRLPLWNPFFNGGTPLLGNPQAMVFFPIDALFLLLPLGLATNLTLVLNLVGAGLTMALFCSRKMVNRGAILLCALSYMLAFRHLAMIDTGWLPKMSMVALTPLLFWGLDVAIHRGLLRDLLVLTLILTLCFLQGDMQQLYYALLGGAAFSLWQLHRTRMAGLASRVTLLGYSALLALLLAAPALLPALEALSLSTRSSSRYEFFFFSAPTARDALTVLHPADQGGSRTEYWENNFYFGLWLYPLILLGAFSRRRLLLPFLGGLVLVGLCFDSMVSRFLFEELPGYSLFRIPSRMLFLAQFTFVVIAGLSLDRLLTQIRESEDGPSRPLAPALALLSLLIAGVGLAFWIPRDPWPLFVVPVLIVAASVPLLVTRGRPAPIALVACLTLCPVIDAAFRMMPRFETLPLAEIFPDEPYLEPMKRDPGSGRAIAVGRAALPYGSAGVRDIALVNGYASLNLRHFVEYFYLMQAGSRAAIPRGPQVWTDFAAVARPDLLEGLDVQHIAASEEIEFEGLGFEPGARGETAVGFDLYRGLVSGPVFTWNRPDPAAGSFASKLVPAGNRSRSLDALDAAAEGEAIVLGLDANQQGHRLGQGTVELVERGTQRYRYRVVTGEGGFLKLRQIWFPGWRAHRNGEEVPLHRTDHALLGCFVPPGEHDLVLTLESPPFRRGLWCAGVALLQLLTLAILASIVRIAGTRRGSRRAGPAVLLLAVVALASTAPGCRSTTRDRVGLDRPLASGSVTHFSGSPLSGVTVPADLEEEIFEPITVTFTALASFPSHELSPVSEQAGLIVHRGGGSPLLPTGRLTRPVRATTSEAEAQEFSRKLDRREFGPHELLDRLHGLTAPGVTARFSLTGLRSQRIVGWPDPVREAVALQVHREEGSAKLLVALTLKDIVPYSRARPTPDPEDDVAPESRVTIDGNTPVLLGETLLLHPGPAGEPGPVLLLIPSPFDPAERAGILARIEWEPVPPPGSDGYSAYADLRDRCLAELRAPFPDRSPVGMDAPEDGSGSGLDQALDGLKDPESRRASVAFLARRCGAALAEDLALAAPDPVLGALVEETRVPLASGAAALTEERLGWILEKAAFSLLARLRDEENLPPALEVLLITHAGEVGRSPGMVRDVLARTKDLSSLAEEWVGENLIFLEDRSPAARVRAHDWLARRGRAPEGYDPLGTREERKAALRDLYYGTGDPR